MKISQNFVAFSEYMNFTYALSFYRSQNALCRSKFFEPAQKFECFSAQKTILLNANHLFKLFIGHWPNFCSLMTAVHHEKCWVIVPYVPSISGQLLDLISLARTNLLGPRFNFYDPWDMANWPASLINIKDWNH